MLCWCGNENRFFVQQNNIRVIIIIINLLTESMKRLTVWCSRQHVSYQYFPSIPALRLMLTDCRDIATSEYYKAVGVTAAKHMVFMDWVHVDAQSVVGTTVKPCAV